MLEGNKKQLKVFKCAVYEAPKKIENNNENRK